MKNLHPTLYSHGKDFWGWSSEEEEVIQEEVLEEEPQQIIIDATNPVARSEQQSLEPGELKRFMVH